MKRLVPNQKVVIRNEGTVQLGKIKCLSKVQKKMVFYDILMEKGNEILFVTTNSEGHSTWIDLNLTNKMFAK